MNIWSHFIEITLIYTFSSFLYYFAFKNVLPICWLAAYSTLIIAPKSYINICLYLPYFASFLSEGVSSCSLSQSVM